MALAIALLCNSSPTWSGCIKDSLPPVLVSAKPYTYKPGGFTRPEKLSLGGQATVYFGPKGAKQSETVSGLITRQFPAGLDVLDTQGRLHHINMNDLDIHKVDVVPRPEHWENHVTIESLKDAIDTTPNPFIILELPVDNLGRYQFSANGKRQVFAGPVHKEGFNFVITDGNGVQHVVDPKILKKEQHGLITGALTSGDHGLTELFKPLARDLKKLEMMDPGISAAKEAAQELENEASYVLFEKLNGQKGTYLAAPQSFGNSDQVPLLLLSPDQIENLPKGTVLWSIFDQRVVKGIDVIDDDTRGGFTAFGLRPRLKAPPTDASTAISVPLWSKDPKSSLATAETYWQEVLQNKKRSDAIYAKALRENGNKENAQIMRLRKDAELQELSLKQANKYMEFEVAKSGKWEEASVKTAKSNMDQAFTRIQNNNILDAAQHQKEDAVRAYKAIQESLEKARNGGKSPALIGSLEGELEVAKLEKYFSEKKYTTLKTNEFSKDLKKIAAKLDLDESFRTQLSTKKHDLAVQALRLSENGDPLKLSAAAESILKNGNSEDLESIQSAIGKIGRRLTEDEKHAVIAVKYLDQKSANAKKMRAAFGNLFSEATDGAKAFGRNHREVIALTKKLDQVLSPNRLKAFEKIIAELPEKARLSAVSALTQWQGDRAGLFETLTREVEKAKLAGTLDPKAVARLLDEIESNAIAYFRLDSAHRLRFYEPSIFNASDRKMLVRRHITLNEAAGFEVREKTAIDWAKQNFNHKNSFKRISGEQSPFDLVYDRIMKLNTDSAKVIRHLKDFETDVLVLARQNDITIEAARQQVLGQYERKGGFTGLIDIATNVSDAEWNAMLREKKIFRDLAFDAGGSHGIDTHRIQWNIVMREMATDPKAFWVNGKQVTPADIYASLGDGEINGGFHPVRKSWAVLFDIFSKNDFSSPAMINRTRDLFGFERWE